MKKRIGYTLLGLLIAALVIGITCIFRYCGDCDWGFAIGLTLGCLRSSGALLLIISGIINLIMEDEE